LPRFIKQQNLLPVPPPRLGQSEEKLREEDNENTDGSDDE
jgi:hypothetical protein